MKRIAAIFVVAAAVSGATPLTASAGLVGKSACVSTDVWPLNVLNVPYCQ